MDLSEAHESTSKQRHPWEVARARHFVDLTAPHLPDDGRLLDVGAGDGYVARTLLKRKPRAHITAWDREYTDDDMRELAGDPRISLTREQPTLDGRDGARFDAATLLDVLEHVHDDAKLLRDVIRLVKPGGAIVISVPAWPSLFGLHDMKLKHLRRYTPEAARALVEREGLRVARCGGLFHSLLPVRAVQTKLEVKTGRMKTAGVGSWNGSAFMTRAVNAALRADTLVSRALSRAHVDAPGLSWWCVART